MVTMNERITLPLGENLQKGARVHIDPVTDCFVELRDYDLGAHENEWAGTLLAGGVAGQVRMAATLAGREGGQEWDGAKISSA